MNIEALEARIAPAILFTYTEFDGDLVTVSISKGAAGDAIFTHPAVPGLFGDQLEKIDLNGNQVFKGANITITAKPQDLNGNGLIRGDGLANVGFIDASGAGGIDLGAVKINGDLAKILAGDATLTTPGLAKLDVLSLGRFGTSTGAPDAGSIIEGKLATLAVKTDLSSFINADAIGAATIVGDLAGGLSTGGEMGPVRIGGDFSGLISATGKIAGVTIGGSMRALGGGNITSNGDMGLIRIAGDLRVDGNSTGNISAAGKLSGVKIGGSFVCSVNSGAITSFGDMGLIEIRGDFRGGSGLGGAAISTQGKLAGVKIGGSMIGGGPSTATISSMGDMGSVRIVGDLVGGNGDNSGKINAGGKLASLTIGGSLLGGKADSSGYIFSTGDIGVVKIGHNLRGGSPTNGGDPSIHGSGYIEGARIASITIGGSIIAGFDFNNADAPTKNASIRARDDIGSLTVKGSLVGNTNGDDVNVIISARGQRGLGPTATTDVAIGKISIGGGTSFVRILAGYDAELAGRNADAQIGAITIGGNVGTTNLIAGVSDEGDGFGNFGDTKLHGIVKDNADGLGAVSRIASVVIKGHALGTISGGDDATFGIEAQHLVSIKIGGALVALKSGAGNDAFSGYPLGPTRTPGGDGFDFHAFEVPLT